MQISGGVRELWIKRNWAGELGKMPTFLLRASAGVYQSPTALTCLLHLAPDKCGILKTRFPLPVEGNESTGLGPVHA